MSSGAGAGAGVTFFGRGAGAKKVTPITSDNNNITTYILIDPLKILIDSCIDFNVDSGSCSCSNLKH